jgi:UDP-GlcNAc:undecaprenyl-phosphate GlcNAc-1-phosphate transferase
VPPLGAYALIGGVAVLGTFLATFPIRWYATRVAFVAEPDERRVHSRVTPYGGGAAMFVAFLLAMMVASLLPARIGLRGLFQNSSEPLGLVLGAAVILGVGLIDDVRDMSAPAKMAGQVLAATVLFYFGVTMFQFKVPLAGLFVVSTNWQPLLTAVWVIVITNAINLIDGLDGLAAGIVAIASGALAVYGVVLVRHGLLLSDNLGPLIAVVTCGVCLGFLPHNFQPARVFMGDAGALLLGLLMAAATMEIGGRTSGPFSGQTYFFFAPLFLPLFILGVPIADMAFAVVRRTAKRQGFHTPDKDHVHHRLLRLGHGHRRTVLILWAWTAVLSGFILVPLFGWKGNAVIPFGVVVLGLFLYTLFRPGLRKNPGDIDEPEALDPPEGTGEAAAVLAGPRAGPPSARPASSRRPETGNSPGLHGRHP